MKAILNHRYADPPQFEIFDIPKPQPKEDEVLIKVHAVSINDFDLSMVTGKPAAYQLIFGLFKPSNPIPGIELSGIVEAVGSKVVFLKPGDAVYGDVSASGWGTYAEFVAVKEKDVVLKPDGMSFEEAAALSHASMLAYQAMFTTGKLSDGERILINGAGGGVGMIGVQLAKRHNCFVVGVDAAEKHEAMHNMGFDETIDYKSHDFTRSKEKYDLIIDTKTTKSPGSYERVLTKRGRYVTVGGTASKLLLVFLKRIVSRKIRVTTLQQNKYLNEINELYERGELKIPIDGPYPIDEAQIYMRYFQSGKHKGRIVLTF